MEQAQGLNLTGKVQNASDGSVSTPNFNKIIVELMVRYR